MEVLRYVSFPAIFWSNFACVFATFISSGDASMPVTVAPIRAKGSDNIPPPQPTSSILIPLREPPVCISFDEVFIMASLIS